MKQQLLPQKNTEVNTTYQLKRKLILSPAEERHEISPELDPLRDMILELMRLEQRVGLPSLKVCDRAKLKAEVGKVNEAVKMI